MVTVVIPDTELYPKTLESFLLTAKQYPDFAIIGPNIIYAETKKKIHYSNQPDVHEAKNIKGFAMFLNLSQFEEIGYFDESFFIYLEEIDLCKRLVEKNKKIYEKDHRHLKNLAYHTKLENLVFQELIYHVL